MTQPENKIEPAPGRATRASTRPQFVTEDGIAPPTGDVLIVESSRLISKHLRRSILAEGRQGVRIAHSFEEARNLVQEATAPFFAAVVNFDLPDAPHGEVVDFTIESGLPTILLVEGLSAAVRTKVQDWDVVDYFFREERSIESVIKKLRRLNENRHTKILLVDDSSTFRRITGNLLRVHRFDPLEAADGETALALLDANPDVSLVITDYEMPRMNGTELIYRIRERWHRDEMGIIGISAFGSGSMSAAFLMTGADDFLTKPFQKEEFYCRLYRSLEAVENIQAIKRIAYTDTLTNLSNRLFFFKAAPAIFEEVVRENQELAIAMLDIDKFKSINDSYGHAAGDAVLRHLGALLKEQLPDVDLISRFGGEEFCVLSRGLNEDSATDLFEGLRARVAASSVRYEDIAISFTLSTGLTLRVSGSLDETINRADQLLYRAKNSGRNRVIVDPEPADGDTPGGD